MTDASALEVTRRGAVLQLTLNRPEKRNALSNAIAEKLESVLANLEKDVRAILIDGAGAHYCAGLDLSEHQNRDPIEVVMISRRWHAIKDRLQFGPCPVITALQGAVIGGGFELAATAHVRVADETAFFQLPEARRGLFIGGGGSVRISRLIGASRLSELMLTGRRLDAAAAERIGLIHNLVPAGTAGEVAMETAQAIAENAPLVNYLIVQALPRIADMSASDGLFTESLAAGLSHASTRAREGMADFLTGAHRQTAANGLDAGLSSPEGHAKPLDAPHDPV